MAGAEVSDVCGFATTVLGFCSSMAGAEVSDVCGLATTVDVDGECPDVEERRPATR
jgi:hypothetical protein